MAEFRLTIDSVWSRGGTVEQFESRPEPERDIKVTVKGKYVNPYAAGG